MFLLKNNNIWESTLIRFFEELETGYNFNQKLISNFKNKVNKVPSKKERESWLRWCYWFHNNKGVFLNDLDKQASVMIEYIVSRNNSRIDFIISGLKTNEKYGSCIIEMKGWEKVNDMPYRLTLNAEDKGSKTERIHPSFSASSYKDEIVHWYKNKNNLSLDINSCVLMHELSESEGKRKLEDEKFDECLQMSPIFYKDDAQNLVKYIKQNVHKKTPELNEWFSEIIYQPSIEKIQEASNLQYIIKKLHETSTFLSASQKKISNFILKTLDTESTSKNNIFIIRGDAGTGKTIVALYLALEMIRKSKAFSLQLPGKDFRDGIKSLLKKENLHTKNVHICANLIFKKDIKHYWENKEGIIIDEAHRLGNTERIKYDIIEDFLKQNNKNIILFLDYNQWCSAKAWQASKLDNLENKYKVYINDDLVLTDQFRYSFSKTYGKWLNSVIESNIRNKIDVKQIKKFKISTKRKLLIIDDPEIFINRFKDEVNKKNNVKLLSTFYHDWTKEIHLQNNDLNDLKIKCKNLGSILVKDVKIGSNSFPWYPFTKFIDYKVYIKGKLLDESISQKYRQVILDEYSKNIKIKEDRLSYVFNSNISNQCVACYNTVQGFEFDSIYVYIGKEMIYNHLTQCFDFNIEWDKNRRKFWKIKRVDLDGLAWKSNPSSLDKKLEIIKNQLKVLLSRGKNKVTIYCEDKNTSDYFKDWLIN